jgi:hypothetical protein
METAKEKAKELVYKFYPNVQWKLGQEDCLERAKSCALILCEEMIKEFEDMLEGDERPSVAVYYQWEYYKEVKQEIELL